MLAQHKYLNNENNAKQKNDNFIYFIITSGIHVRKYPKVIHLQNC